MSTQPPPANGNQDVIAMLCDYIAESHLDGRAEVTADAPLLEWGVLDSLGLNDLIEFIDKRFGIAVPRTEITPANFRSVETISALLARLRLAQ